MSFTWIRFWNSVGYRGPGGALTLSGSTLLLPFQVVTDGC